MPRNRGRMNLAPSFASASSALADLRSPTI